MVPARDLITLNYGRALKADTRSSGKVPVFGTNGRCGWHDKPLSKGPGLILGRKGQGPLGVEWCDQDFWVIDTAYYASTLTHDLDLKYLYYLVKHVGLNHLKDGTSNPTLARDTFGAQLLPLPPLAEQRAIAAVLGALDDKIELNRRMNVTLEAMARALYQSWFVDFDPVRAKLDGRCLAAVDIATAALFPTTFQDSPLGHIPRGWETGSILWQADLLSGGTPKTDVPDYWNGDIPWASARDVSQCGEAFLVSTERGITKQGVNESSTKIVPDLATVVVARGATTGRLTMVAHAMAMNQTCYGLRSKVGAPFALYCNARHFIERLVQGGHGSIFDTITTSTFEATQVLLAPKEVLRAFDKQVAPLFQQIRANLYQSSTLATLRDTLLPKLLSGELSVAGLNNPEFPEGSSRRGLTT